MPDEVSFEEYWTEKINQEWSSGEPVEQYPEPPVYEYKGDNAPFYFTREQVVLAFFGGLMLGLLIDRAFGGG